MLRLLVLPLFAWYGHCRGRLHGGLVGLAALLGEELLPEHLPDVLLDFFHVRFNHFFLQLGFHLRALLLVAAALRVTQSVEHLGDADVLVTLEVGLQLLYRLVQREGALLYLILQVLRINEFINFILFNSVPPRIYDLLKVTLHVCDESHFLLECQLLSRR